DLSMASAANGGRIKFREKAESGLEAAMAIDDPYPAFDEDWRISVMWRLSLEERKNRRIPPLVLVIPALCRDPRRLTGGA
uniref:hypothetical protein n=1 Tax=Staphylococcus sp. GDY8P161P TaxID=2804434 RepID=UPI00194E70BD